ncbi:conserved hypothetical protein [Culex quinquefasciatus]|uniref:Groucho/TLE N-terminal Q-rich domain-containing protein n=1 Tax=Culex quinquefasciatus TaxID=7176 RepID=B0WU77_CULQU|nr:conserved hypothetical protein [Culex quinquefasciatus]|eukprot:XP_001870912.1 conserved hypothetical protein [Culex quinquefasciatus]
MQLIIPNRAGVRDPVRSFRPNASVTKNYIKSLPAPTTFIPSFHTEIAKRLNALIGQLLPFLATEHQQQVAQAVERAKQVTMPELNAIIGFKLLIPNFEGTGRDLIPEPSACEAEAVTIKPRSRCY